MGLKQPRGFAPENLPLAVGSGRLGQMNDGIFGEEVAVILHFVIEDGGLEEHLLGVLQVLPHGQLGRLRILAHQGLEDLVVIVAPAGDGLVVDMLVELAPVGVALAMQPGSQGFGVGEIVVKRGSEVAWWSRQRSGSKSPPCGCPPNR